jgi:hypothetical protein
MQGGLGFQWNAGWEVYKALFAKMEQGFRALAVRDDYDFWKACPRTLTLHLLTCGTVMLDSRWCVETRSVNTMCHGQAHSEDSGAGKPLLLPEDSHTEDLHILFDDNILRDRSNIADPRCHPTRPVVLQSEVVTLPQPVTLGTHSPGSV